MDTKKSSHFSIKLPNTYLEGKNMTVGGAYCPHLYSGETWNLDAHKHLKKSI